MIKKGFLYSLFLVFLLSISAFSFPEVDHFAYYGRISFSKNKEKIGYILNHYNKQSQKVREEIYNEKGEIVKYKTFEYDYMHLLTKETVYDNRQNMLREVSYKNINGRVKQKVVKELNKLPLYIDTDYSFYKNKLLYKIDKYYYEDNDRLQRVIRFKKTVYSYRKENEKLTEHYIKEGDGRNQRFRFKTAELFKYNGVGRIGGIFLMDSRRNPVKYFEYVYNEFNKIKMIKIYRTWSRGSYHKNKYLNLNEMKLNLKQSVLYEYSPDKFSSVKKLSLTPKEDLDKKIVKKDPDKKIVKKVIIVAPTNDKKVDAKVDEEDEDEEDEDEEDEDEEDEDEK